MRAFVEEGVHNADEAVNQLAEFKENMITFKRDRIWRS